MDLLEKRINIVQGEYRVSEDEHVVLTTLLGSCVAACIRDPVARVGGMNHFLLPGAEARSRASAGEQYGVHLMELLINDLMRKGAQRDRMEAKVFGGARMMSGLSDIGQKNGEFASTFLRHEGIRVVGGDLGGTRGRRLQYWPVSGRARQSYVSSRVENIDVPVRQVKMPSHAGEVELF